MNYSNKTFKLTFSAVMIALSTALSFVQVYKLPLGGSITLFSMVPICLIGAMYGTVYAILPCFVYGALQFLLGGALGWGLTAGVLISCIIFDYLLPYSFMSVSGILRKKGTGGIIFGVVFGCTLRFMCHFISGFILWANIEQFDLFGKSYIHHPVIYSLVYNGSYMLPELILTVTGTVLLMRVPIIKKLTQGKDIDEL